MPDREKVIESLDEHLHCSGRGKSGYCPYSDNELWNDISDALALLKEQEPVKPDIDSEGTCTCGNCGETVGYYPVGCNTPEKFGEFCPECGRKVKWDA